MHKSDNQSCNIPLDAPLRQGVEHTTIKLRRVLARERDLLGQVRGHELHHVGVAAGVQQRRVQELGLEEAGALGLLGVDEELEVQCCEGRRG